MQNLILQRIQVSLGEGSCLGALALNYLDEIPFGVTPVDGVALVGTMAMASKIVKSAKERHLNIRNFDKAERLLQVCLAKMPKIIVLDFETREAEAFRFLKAHHENAELRKAAVVGFVTSVKRDVKREAENGGCLRVFLKTEFLAGLDEIWLRYAK